MSRIQAGAVELMTSAVDAEEVIARAIVDLDDRGREIVVDHPEGSPAILADAALLERALANVIDNAIKWSPPSSPITVRTGTHRDHAMIIVIDHGPGIRPQDRERVFEPFQRTGDAPSVNGTGLGLAVARGFIELMHGSIAIDDTPGGGTTVVISLPTSPVAR